MTLYIENTLVVTPEKALITSKPSSGAASPAASPLRRSRAPGGDRTGASRATNRAGRPAADRRGGRAGQAPSVRAAGLL